MKIRDVIKACEIKDSASPCGFYEYKGYPNMYIVKLGGDTFLFVDEGHKGHPKSTDIDKSTLMVFVGPLPTSFLHKAATEAKNSMPPEEKTYSLFNGTTLVRANMSPKQAAEIFAAYSEAYPEATLSLKAD